MNLFILILSFLAGCVAAYQVTKDVLRQKFEEEAVAKGHAVYLPDDESEEPKFYWRDLR